MLQAWGIFLETNFEITISGSQAGLFSRTAPITYMHTRSAGAPREDGDVCSFPKAVRI